MITKPILTVLLLFTITNSQTPDIVWVKWNNEWTHSKQRANAEIVYWIGHDYNNQGHTAVGLYWMESSLGVDPSHHSFFGLTHIAMKDLKLSPTTIDSLKNGLIDLERQTVIALDYFNLLKRRHLRKISHKGKAWILAAESYKSNGSKVYALAFNKRVRYLKGRTW